MLSVQLEATLAAVSSSRVRARMAGAAPGKGEDRGRGQRGQAVDQRDGGVGEQGGGGRGHRGRLDQVAAEQDLFAPAVPGDRGRGATSAAGTSWTSATSPVAAAPPTS